MKKRIKILFIHHGAGIGGAPISLRNLILNLNIDKYQCKVLCLRPGSHIKLFEDAGIDTELITAPKRFFSHTQTGRKQWYYFPYLIPILIEWVYTAFYFAPKHLKMQDCDIIHLNSHVLSSWAFAAKKRNFKVIMHNREAITKGYLGIRYIILKTLISKYCDFIINISEDNKKRLGLINKSTVIYNFVDIPKEYRLTMSNAKDQKKILYLGGSASIKGFDTLVDSLKFLDEGIVVQIAGHINKTPNDILQRNIVKYIKEVITKKNKRIEIIENSSNTEILGVLDNPYPYIDGCDILITPFKIEHFSRPAIEAFAYGKPVIGSDVEGMEEIIDHELNGLLIRKNMPIDLARAINRLCNEPIIAQSFGDNGRKKAIDQFSVKPNIQKIEMIYTYE